MLLADNTYQPHYTDKSHHAGDKNCACQNVCDFGANGDGHTTEDRWGTDVYFIYNGTAETSTRTAAEATFMFKIPGLYKLCYQLAQVWPEPYA